MAKTAPIPEQHRCDEAWWWNQLVGMWIVKGPHHSPSSVSGTPSVWRGTLENWAKVRIDFYSHEGLVVKYIYKIKNITISSSQTVSEKWKQLLDEKCVCYS